MPVFDTTSVIGGFGQIIQNDWALGDDRQFSGDTQLSPNPPPPSDLDLTDAYFTLKSASTLPDADSLIQKHITQSSTVNGQIIAGLGGALSKLLIKIASGDYEGINNIVAGPAYPWDIRVITTAGVTLTVATGVAIFLQNDTQTNKSGTPAAFPNNGQPRFRGYIFDKPSNIMGLSAFYNAGDVYWNSNPSNGNGLGWICATGGIAPATTWFTFDQSQQIDPIVVANSQSPFTAKFNEFIAASAGVASDTNINLPHATGSQRIIVIKKIDAGIFNVNAVPSGTDTIDGVNAPYPNSTQYQSFNLKDFAPGVWLIF